MERENRNLEYKENVSRSYLKTVSAFANYNDGTIIFGINDKLEAVGLDDPVTQCLNIKNQINDNIKPKPDYSLRINDNHTISLSVRKGDATPYRYNGKCYIRNDSSTVETDSIQENRLILSGMNKNFEDFPCGREDLSFEQLSAMICSKLNLNEFNLDTLKTLNLYNDKTGFNNAALLLSDNNRLPGTDIAVFGTSYNEFRRRITLSGISLLKQYEESLKVFEEEYIVERIDGGYRSRYELVPYESFREAVANTLIHRAWDIPANTKIEMHKDKIIISSPGGLPSNMSTEDYLRGNYSYLRNPIIASVFHRLDIVEIFATGIKRINKSYENRIIKPVFEVTDTSISITLPVENDNLSLNETRIFSFMKENIQYTRTEIELNTGMSKDTVIRVLNQLIEKNLIQKSGKGKSIRYFKN